MVSQQFYVEMETEEIAGGRGFMLSVVPTGKVFTDKTANLSIYCRVPARWGLQQTTLAPGSDETRARDPLKLKNTDRPLDPFY